MQSIFFLFWFFKILIFQFVIGERGWGIERVKNDPKWEKHLSVAPYISGIIHLWSSCIVHVCKTIISPGILFIVTKRWFLGLLVGWKGKKWTKNNRKFCLSCSVFQEPYIIWSWFLVHMIKMMISPVDFFLFNFLCF